MCVRLYQLRSANRHKGTGLPVIGVRRMNDRVNVLQEEGSRFEGNPGYNKRDDDTWTTRSDRRFEVYTLFVKRFGTAIRVPSDISDTTYVCMHTPPPLPLLYIQLNIKVYKRTNDLTNHCTLYAYTCSPKCGVHSPYTYIDIRVRLSIFHFVNTPILQNEKVLYPIRIKGWDRGSFLILHNVIRYTNEIL